MTQASVVLHDAQKKLRDSGWIRGSLHTSRGYCALGAIDAVRCGILHDCQMQARRRLYETHLFRSPLSFVMGVDTWNDCPWRREATVLARFRKAEKHARRDEERNKLHVDLQFAAKIGSARVELQQPTERTVAFPEPVLVS